MKKSLGARVAKIVALSAIILSTALTLRAQEQANRIQCWPASRIHRDFHWFQTTNSRSPGRIGR